MDVASSSTASAPTHNYKYDIFLSFRGKDTRRSFTNHLYKALRKAGISTYHDEEIREGQELNRSITESRASLIVISKNYAESTWCLDELWLILEQRRKSGHVVFPVYYGVDPSDVRNQRDDFRIEAKEGSIWTADNVKRWKAALTEVTNLRGSVVSGFESEFFRKITSELGVYLLSNVRGLTGIEAGVERINSFLRPEHDIEGRSIGNLFVSSKEIAKGSEGTVVREGIYLGHKVAVKCVAMARHDVAVREIANLLTSNNHSNIVHFYHYTRDWNYVYLALECCDCTLYDLIKNEMYSESFQLWTPNGYPSSILSKLMSDIVAGLEHLHELGIIHGDLKPQNVLISKGKALCPKLSDMGSSRRVAEGASSLEPEATVSGTPGWQAPEQILGGHQTLATDMYSLGRVFLFIMARGGHLFDDTPYEREGNVINNNIWLVQHIPEAVDLCSRLLSRDPILRPKASEVQTHLLCWDSEKRMSFIKGASDWADSEHRRGVFIVRIALESEGRVDFTGRWWHVKMDSAFIKHMREKRKRPYEYDSVEDLLRIIRNTESHYHELPKNIKDLLGSWPEGVDDYFRKRFPKLLMVVYNIMYRLCKQEDWFLRYI